MNIEHPTFNIQHRIWFASSLYSAFLGTQLRAKSQHLDVPRWMFICLSSVLHPTYFCGSGSGSVCIGYFFTKLVCRQYILFSIKLNQNLAIPVVIDSPIQPTFNIQNTLLSTQSNCLEHVNRYSTDCPRKALYLKQI